MVTSYGPSLPAPRPLPESNGSAGNTVPTPNPEIMT